MTKLMTFAVILGAALTLGLAMSTEKTDAAADTGYKFVTDIDVLMSHVQDVYDEAPRKPEKTKGFRKTRQSARVLAEFANLFGYVDEYRDNATWKKYLDDMGAACQKLAKAAKKKDLAAMDVLFKAIEESCEGCHEDIRDA